MKVFLTAAVVSLALAPAAAAEAPSWKMTDANFGNVDFGTRVSVSVTVTNRTDAAILITGWSLSSISGWFPGAVVGGSCQDLRGDPVGLLPGAGCEQTISLTPAKAGPYTATTCVFTNPYFEKPGTTPCSTIRGHVRG